MAARDHAIDVLLAILIVEQAGRAEDSNEFVEYVRNLAPELGNIEVAKLIPVLGHDLEKVFAESYSSRLSLILTLVNTMRSRIELLKRQQHEAGQPQQ